MIRWEKREKNQEEHVKDARATWATDTHGQPGLTVLTIPAASRTPTAAQQAGHRGRTQQRNR